MNIIFEPLTRIFYSVQGVCLQYYDTYMSGILTQLYLSRDNSSEIDTSKFYYCEKSKCWYVIYGLDTSQKGSKSWRVDSDLC
jgi:hypothetical protein